MHNAVEKAQTVKFIMGRLKHKSTKVADKPRLADCLYTLTAGHELDQMQHAFVEGLKRFESERRKKYYNNKMEKLKQQRQLERLAIEPLTNTF